MLKREGIRDAYLGLALAVITGPAYAQTWVYEPDTVAPGYRPRVVYQERYVAPPYYNAYSYATSPAVGVGTVRRTVVSRTTIPQGRGRGPIVKERIMTETNVSTLGDRAVIGTAVAAYAYAPTAREAYAMAPGPRAVTRPVAVTESYAYAPGPQGVVIVPVVRTYVNPLAYDPATGVFLTDR